MQIFDHLIVAYIFGPPCIFPFFDTYRVAQKSKPLSRIIIKSY